MFTSRPTQSCQRRRGAIVVLVAVCLIVILAFVAIAIDGGGLLEQRRSAQATADAAALAAADSLFQNFPEYKGVDVDGTAAAWAWSIAAANGFPNDGTNSVVTVQTSPDAYTGGPNEGKPLPKGYVEVTVQRNQPRYFSAIMGTGSIPVRARAVARGAWEPSFVGIHVLDLHEPSALRATGVGSGGVSGGAHVIVNSDAVDAATANSGTISASRFDIVGGTVGDGFVGEVVTGVQPEPDPLRNIPQPVRSDMNSQSNGPKHFSNGNRTIWPGVYTGGITITGRANVTMMPGIYYMDGGGFSMSGQGSLYAEGVMIFSDPKQPSDHITITGSDGGSIYVTPPTSGIYKGLTLFQDRSADQSLTISGGGNFHMTVTFYAAGALMNVTGGSDSTIGSQYISRLLDITGNAGLNIDYNPDQVIPVRVLGLVE